MPPESLRYSPVHRADVELYRRVDQAVTHCRRLVSDRDSYLLVASGLIPRITQGKGKGHPPALDKVIFNLQPERLLSDRAKTLDNEDLRNILEWEASRGYLEPCSIDRIPPNYLLVHLQDSSLFFAELMATRIGQLREANGLDKIPECTFHGVPLDLVQDDRKAFAAVAAVIHFIPNVEAWDYHQRRSILARWLWCRYWQSPVPESNNNPVTLYDIPSLMFSKDELPDDPAEATQMARKNLTTLMTRYQADYMYFRNVPEQPDESVMPQVFLVDSAPGERMQWAEPDMVCLV